jgi:pimeloyl-ACP methyl ester carboxylesterase
VSDPSRVAEYVRTPWKLELDKMMWDHDHPEGVARAIRGVVEDWPVSDRGLLRKISAPVLLVCIEGDEIHPAELGRVLHDLLPNGELLVYPSAEALFLALPEVVQRVSAFLVGG